MSQPDFEEIVVHNQAELEELAWAIESSAGQFTLILARCNYVNLRSHLIDRLQEMCPLTIQVLTVQKTSQTLYSRIREFVDSTPTEALMVVGLETVGDLDAMLSAVNSVREEFRKNFPFPLVLWITDELHQKLVKLTPDFESWATTTAFTLPAAALRQIVQQASDRLFTHLFTPHSTSSFNKLLRNLDLGFLQRSELETALQQLQQKELSLDSDLQATLYFLRGFNASSNQEALENFRQSLERSQEGGDREAGGDKEARGDKEAGGDKEEASPSSSLKEALLLFYLGRVIYYLCDQEKYTKPDWEPARVPLVQAVQLFEQAGRPDLAAKCVTQLQRLLQRLRLWDELEALAQRSRQWHQDFGMVERLAQDYGFLADVALHREQWTETLNLAQQALTVVGQLPGEPRWDRAVYLLLMARAERQLGNLDRALEHLLQAQAMGDRGHPSLYISILEKLREIYLIQKQYLVAFQLKQERFSIEQQYGIRAFVGAGRLRPRRQAADGQLTPEASLETVAPEIATAGRQRDLQCLIERIGRNDYSLIAIHGNSGVGKSSILHAGLLPVLRERAIGIEHNLPVVLRKYTDWVGALQTELAVALEQRGISPAPVNWEIPPTPLNKGGSETGASVEAGELNNLSPRPVGEGNTRGEVNFQGLMQQLRQNKSRLLRTVLIFDQFEEFFFVYPTPAERQPFFAFLGECLLAGIKVVLVLREDYLHYLLECNRIPAIQTTGIDLLSRNVLYPLGNFSPADARSIIQDLTNRSRFDLEPALIEELVRDLTDAVGEVRPIELQIVGAQLQTEGIRDLATYRQLCQTGKPAKETLVERYLAEVVADCGGENQKIAELVLYLLTDERGTRPLKTRDELENGLQTLLLDIVEAANQLDLVLTILVKSGLVSHLLEVPEDRYQLVHDYLAEFIRQHQGDELAELKAELVIERSQRKLSEEKLDRVEQANQILAEAQRQASHEQLPSRGWMSWKMLATALGVAGCIITLRLTGFLQGWELAALDQSFQLRPLEPVDERVVIVGINEADLQSIKQYPVSDSVMAKLLQKIQTYQPRAIGLNIFRNFPVEPGRQALEQVFQTFPHLIGIQKIKDQSSSSIPAPPILEQRGQVGFANLVFDVDGRVRRGILYWDKNENVGLKVALIYLQEKGIIPESSASDHRYLQLGKAVFRILEPNDGAYTNVDARGYQFLANLRGPANRFRTVSMTDVLEGQVQADWLRDRIVLIGYQAESVKDYFYTSYSSSSMGSYSPEATSGVELLANLISQIISAAVDGRPLIQVWSEPGEWLWIVIWSYLGAQVVWKLRFLYKYIPTILLLAVGLVGTCYVAFLWSWWIPLIPPLLGLTGSAFIAVIVIISDREKFRLYRTLELLVEAYQEIPSAGRSAIEFFVNSTNEKKFVNYSLISIAINALKQCQTLEEIGIVSDHLLCLPSSLPGNSGLAVNQLLGISQAMKEALNSGLFDEVKKQDINLSIAALKQLKEDLTPNIQTIALRKIIDQWIIILSNFMISDS